MSKTTTTEKAVTKSKTDLFRFATLRSPQLISKRRRSLGFVEISNPTKSHFLGRITNDQDYATARQKLMAAISGFSPFNSVEEVKSFAGNLWEFSMWLGKNKNDLAETDRLNASKQGVGTLTLAQYLTIWDNVFYDILTQKNAHVRQACLQLLVTMHFLELYPQEMNNLQELKRIANAKVVVPAVFSKKEEESYGKQATMAIGNNAALKRALKLQQTICQRVEAEQSAEELEAIRAELSVLETKYEEDFQAASRKAGMTYDKEVISIVEHYKKSKKIDPNTNLSEDEIPAGLIPAFGFEYPKPLSKIYTGRKLTPAAKAFIEKHRLLNASVQEAIVKADQELSDLRRIAAGRVTGEPKSIIIKGVKLQNEPIHIPTYTIGTRMKPAANGHSLEIYLCFRPGYAQPDFTEADITIELSGTLSGKHVVKRKDLILLPVTERQVVFALLKVILLSEAQHKQISGLSIKATGSWLMDNGKRYTLTSKVATTQRPDNGMVTEVAEDVMPMGEIIHYGISKIGIADYRRVEQELCCYIPGEVSHIENILAREYKEKATRQLVRSEDITESTTEIEREELNDTTSTSKNEMSSEIAQVIQTDRSMGIGFTTGASGEYVGTTFNASLTGDFSYGQSSSDSDTVARTYAEDVTRRALERIVQKNTIKRTTKILREFEENNKHGYDNRSGDKHVTGVFRWIDKIYKNQLVNYGKRLTYEFMLPEPARFYKDLIILEADSQTDPNQTGTGSDLVAPIHPKDLDQPINSASDITRANYTALAAHYGVTVPVPAAASQTVQATYSKNIPYGDQGQQTTTNFQNPLAIPVDYECVRLKHDLTIDIHRTFVLDNHWKMDVSTTQSRTEQRPPEYGNGNISRSYTLYPPGVTGMINTSVICTRVRAFTISLDALCNLKASVFQQWQQDVYAAIMAAYQQQLSAYNQAIAANNTAVQDEADEEDGILKTNPLYNKQFILNELKRLCIEMMLKPFGLPQGMDFYENGPCNVPQLKLGAELDSYSRQVKFFEQAFDWSILSNIFYPYYWAKKCDWKALFQSQDSVDHVLQAFLQSGMARVLVPVREGFEDAVVYFMETGEIWHGTGLVINTDDELYLSIVDEVTYHDGEVEEEWETIVPTTLTIVQGRSAYLDDEGLPCCHSDKPEGQILADTNVLELLEGK